MANPLQQAAVRRKVVYVAIIVGLFTLSLVWRGKVHLPGQEALAASAEQQNRGRVARTLAAVAASPIEEQARALELRELDQGDPEVVWSAARLSLVGFRGLVVTMLWKGAMDAQRRNEWHQLERLIGVVTRLQPNFVTPWMYQSWNLAYNVSVENDKLGDMYYYIARGIDLLAQGDRLNTKEYRGKTLGSPDMRYFCGFYYQNKFGVSDKVQTLRSLGQLSVIPPDERDPAILTPPTRTDPDDPTRTIATPWAEHKPWVDFCTAHPQLLWRLRNKLDLVNPEQVVRFLRDNEKIPARYLPTGEPAPDADQFPILPPRFNADDYDPSVKRIPDDTYDPHLAARAWFNYAMEVVPPAVTWPAGTDFAGKPVPWTTPKPAVDFDEFAYRLPRQPAYVIFCQYPARAQTYQAERLADEGWFDASSGWAPDVRANPSDYWLKTDPADPDVVLTTPASAQEAYRKAYTMWREHGERHALELSAAELRNLEQLARPVRIDDLTTLDRLTPEQMQQYGWALDNVVAKKAQIYYAQNRQMTNFPYFLATAEAEQADLTVAARKLLWQAERKVLAGSNPEAIGLYVAGLAKLHQALTVYPKFYRPERSETTEEDLYEQHLKLIDLLKIDNDVQDQVAAVRKASRAVAPGLADALSDEISQAIAEDEAAARIALVNARDHNGFQSRLREPVRDDALYLAGVTQYAAFALAGFAAEAPGQNVRITAEVTRRLADTPERARALLNSEFAWMKTRSSPGDPDPWVRDGVKQTVMQRLGKVKQTAPVPTGAPEGESPDAAPPGQ